MILDDRNSWKDGKFGQETFRKANVQGIFRGKKMASVPKSWPGPVPVHLLDPQRGRLLLDLPLDLLLVVLLLNLQLHDLPLRRLLLQLSSPVIEDNLLENLVY